MNAAGRLWDQAMRRAPLKVPARRPASRGAGDQGR